MKKVRPGRHRLLLFWKENLAVSLIYSPIFRFIETLTFLHSIKNLDYLWVFALELYVSCILDIKPLSNICFGNILSICKLPFDFADVPLFGVGCGPTSLFLQLLPLLLV